jgi:hypothetical protein
VTGQRDPICTCKGQPGVFRVWGVLSGCHLQEKCTQEGRGQSSWPAWDGSWSCVLCHEGFAGSSSRREPQKEFGQGRVMTNWMIW